MCRWPVALSVEFGVVRLVLLEHIVDNRKEHSGNGDNGFLVAATLLRLQGTEPYSLVLERASGTHTYSVQHKAEPIHLHVLCSVPVSSSIF